MWLINTTTLILESFMTCPIRSYAILSHTWENEELDFDLFRSGGGQDKQGYTKIEHCCKQAISDGYMYAWVDTVCIDKRSSTELSEAINSMFTWYFNAGVCYTYLQDFQPGSEVENIGQCRWFSRGWTLQELIAPVQVIFFNSQWKKFGSRASLCNSLASITGIDEAVLKKIVKVSTCSIAARMSWAAHRQTTRIEDIAYCLLGIFDINFPLLYGEGHKAFKRLQEAIIANSDDESIFAWTGVNGSEGSGLLADAPFKFADAADIVSDLVTHTSEPLNATYSITFRGLAIERQLLPIRMNTYVTPLRCRRRTENTLSGPLGIYVCRTSMDHQYRRIAIEGIDLPCLNGVESWKIKKAAKHLLYFDENRPLLLASHESMPTVRFARLPGNTTALITDEPDGEAWRCVTMTDFQKGLMCPGEYTEMLFHLRVGFNLRFEPICVLYRPSRFPSFFILDPLTHGLSFPQDTNDDYFETCLNSSLVHETATEGRVVKRGHGIYVLGDRFTGFSVTIPLNNTLPLFGRSLELKMSAWSAATNSCGSVFWEVTIRLTEEKALVKFARVMVIIIPTLLHLNVAVLTPLGILGGVTLAVILKLLLVNAYTGIEKLSAFLLWLLWVLVWALLLYRHTIQDYERRLKHLLDSGSWSPTLRHLREYLSL